MYTPSFYSINVQTQPYHHVKSVRTTQVARIPAAEPHQSIDYQQKRPERVHLQHSRHQHATFVVHDRPLRGHVHDHEVDASAEDEERRGAQEVPHREPRLVERCGRAASPQRHVQSAHEHEGELVDEQKQCGAVQIVAADDATAAAKDFERWHGALQTDRSPLFVGWTTVFIAMKSEGSGSPATSYTL